MGRKHSAQYYSLNIIENTIKLHDELVKGTYREGRTRIVKITYPKPRTALSITFRDRVFQRSLNDNSLYPQMTRSFVWENMACQKGKGTTAARNAFRAMLHRAYMKYGTNRFQILSCDVKGYYDNMRHDVTERMVSRHCDGWTAEKVRDTLSHQYRFHGEKGYNPGSQMVQIAGISYLSQLDHFVKESMRRKFYLRYMDDFQILGAPDEDMDEVKDAVDAELEKVGLWLHPDKTNSTTADRGVLFLGFLFRVTETGKVLVFRSPKRVKELRRRMRRLANKIVRDKMDVSILEDSYRCARSCMEEGNSKRLLRNMDYFMDGLRKEIRNGKNVTD